MVMLSDAVTAKQQSGEAKDGVQVLDVSQILARSLVAAKEPALVGGGAVTEDVTTEAPKPVLADPRATEVADYPQLAQEGAPARTPEGHGPTPGAGPAHSTGTPGDAPGGASEGHQLGGPERPDPRPAGDPDTAP
jgi:hypothetical protein